MLNGLAYMSKYKPSDFKVYSICQELVQIREDIMKESSLDDPGLIIRVYQSDEVADNESVLITVASDGLNVKHGRVANLLSELVAHAKPQRFMRYIDNTDTQFIGVDFESTMSQSDRGSIEQVILHTNTSGIYGGMMNLVLAGFTKDADVLETIPESESQDEINKDVDIPQLIQTHMDEIKQDVKTELINDMSKRTIDIEKAVTTSVTEHLMKLFDEKKVSFNKDIETAKKDFDAYCVKRLEEHRSAMDNIEEPVINTIPQPSAPVTVIKPSTTPLVVGEEKVQNTQIIKTITCDKVPIHELIEMLNVDNDREFFEEIINGQFEKLSADDIVLCSEYNVVDFYEDESDDIESYRLAPRDSRVRKQELEHVL